MPKLESVIRNEIRDFLKDEVGATYHKYHGSVFAERGVPDIFGTLPGGRAYYFEVKRPGRLGKIAKIQELLLQNEAMHGAVAAFATSVDDVKQALLDQGYDYKRRHPHPLD